MQRGLAPGPGLGRRDGAGVCGAALADLGLPLELLRGFALLARTAGLLGHLAEELRQYEPEHVDPDRGERRSRARMRGMLAPVTLTRPTRDTSGGSAAYTSPQQADGTDTKTAKSDKGHLTVERMMLDGPRGSHCIWA